MGKVLKAVADIENPESGRFDAWIQKSFAGQSDLWATYEMRFTAAQLTFWRDTVGGSSPTPDFHQLLSTSQPQTGATEPVWASSVGDDDGIFGWNQAVAFVDPDFVPVEVVEWAATTAYPADGSIAVLRDGSAWFPQTAGTSGGSEPDWASEPAYDVDLADGGVNWRRTWRYIGAWAAFTTLDFTLPEPKVFATTPSVPDGTLYVSGGAAPIAWDEVLLGDDGLNGFGWRNTGLSGGIPSGDAYHLIEHHYTAGGDVDVYIDGDLTLHDPGRGFVDVFGLRLGQDLTSESNDPDPGPDPIYFRHPKVGTTRGAADVFEDDFSSGDLSAWDLTLGDVSVVEDPFPDTSFPIQVLDRPSWRWIITQLRTSRVLTSLTTIATDITTSRLLAASWPAALTVPSDDPRVRTIYLEFDEHPEWDEPFVAKDLRVLVGFRNTGLADPLWECAYTGIVKQVTDRVADGVPQTTINCWDARKYLEFLPLVDADGNLPGEDGLPFNDTANAIARAALENWITNNPGCLADTLFDLTSGLDEDCAVLSPTFERGTTINDVWTQLEQAGAIDIVLDPVFDPRVRPGCLAVVNFEVEHGAQRHAAIFSWDRSPRSLPEISRMEDGLKLANTIQDYTDDVEPAAVQVNADSVTRFGEYWAMRAWPGQQDADTVAAFAAEELLFRADGQTTVEASPAAPRALQPIQKYDIGDRVPVYASERLRKPIAATMRIYGIPFTIDESAHETVSGLTVSADAVS